MGSPVRYTIAVIVVLLGWMPTNFAIAGETLDLTNYQETFSETCDVKLDVSAWGPSRWIAHTPWHGDFGDARFVDPRQGFPFSCGSDGLKITARKNATGLWESGLLATRDDKRRGFVQAGGYFEARIKMPDGPGVWPAFWLASEGNKIEKSEIDIVEYYGRRMDRYHSVVHVWGKLEKGKDSSAEHIVDVPNGSLVNAFHAYGVEILDSEIVFYFDRQEVWRVTAPPSAHQPMMILVNLALGSGWPIDGTINPSAMQISYIKAYVRRKQN